MKILSSMVRKIQRFFKRGVEGFLVNALKSPAVRTVIAEYLDAHAEHLYSHLSRNIDWHLQLEAVRQSAIYAGENFQNARAFESKYQLIDYILESFVPPDGLYAEFGVYKGETVNYIANRINGEIHGFDSFNGLPEFWRPGFGVSAFRIDNEEDLQFNNNVIIHKGFFIDTLPTFIKSYPETMAFIHIDCDLYSSAKTVLTFLGEKICSGTIIVFDEYINYPGWQNHEFLAFQEFIIKHNKSYEYLGYNNRDEQVAVRIL